nr:mucin-7-like [Aegilops tauschii subsp. strangulata]
MNARRSTNATSSRAPPPSSQRSPVLPAPVPCARRDAGKQQRHQVADAPDGMKLPVPLLQPCVPFSPRCSRMATSPASQGPSSATPCPSHLCLLFFCIEGRTRMAPPHGTFSAWSFFICIRPPPSRSAVSASLPSSPASSRVAAALLPVVQRTPLVPATLTVASAPGPASAAAWATSKQAQRPPSSLPLQADRAKSPW